MSDSVRTPQMAAHQLPRPWDSSGKNTGVGCHFLLQCMKVKNENEVAQSCPTLCDPMDCSLPGSSIHGIFQARVLEWGAIWPHILENIQTFQVLNYNKNKGSPWSRRKGPQTKMWKCRKKWRTQEWTNMDGLGRHYATWNKTEEKQMLYHSYVGSKKIQQTSENNQKEADGWIQRTNWCLPVR